MRRVCGVERAADGRAERDAADDAGRDVAHRDAELLVVARVQPLDVEEAAREDRRARDALHRARGRPRGVVPRERKDERRKRLSRKRARGGGGGGGRERERERERERVYSERQGDKQSCSLARAVEAS